MIRKRIHPSAAVEHIGPAMMPDGTIIEPLAVMFVGEWCRFNLGEMNTVYHGATIRIDQG